jgi:hypothetical protein
MNTLERRIAKLALYLENGADRERDHELLSSVFADLTTAGKEAVIEGASLRFRGQQFNRSESDESEIRFGSFKRMVQSIYLLADDDRNCLLDTMGPDLRALLTLQWEILESEARDYLRSQGVALDAPINEF